MVLALGTGKFGDCKMILFFPPVHNNIDSFIIGLKMTQGLDNVDETFYAMYHRKLGQRFEGPTNKIMGTSYKLSSMDSPACPVLGQSCLVQLTGTALLGD
ncbi:hypothetical protein CEXT_131961 [Caerostris extrusa]|uniref:Uncharacterized protein n=1 Tax=Caerostris extrusa TaxID=172846 RepID=A0AAV4QT09_CAEEX|nr:hypothetical protein CEXT_131961 [Caerostris extrusa]